MLPHSDQGQGEPTFLLMLFLGGSHRTWFPTLPPLNHRYRCVALNTQGVGDTTDIGSGYGISVMADHLDVTTRGLPLSNAFCWAIP